MRQLLYISTSTQPVIGEELAIILLKSRRNNARDALTGLLWTDGARFLQVLEGETEAVEATFSRIRQDLRHRALVILHDRNVHRATFGAWSMALVSDDDARIASALADADPVIRGTFEGVISTRKAAA